LHPGIYALAGMMNDSKAELILTADGILRNIYFAEDLAAAAPPLKLWQITALKPAQDVENVNITTEGITFNADNIWFYAKDHPGMPDEIDIIAVHEGLTAQNKNVIGNGIYIFLDNYLGELNFIDRIDNLQICSRSEAEQPLIPIAKLKEYLAWRENEFVEKYASATYDNEHSEHHVGEATLANGRNLVMIVNSGLLKWEYRASHPWVLVITISYEHHNNGMPTPDVMPLLQRIDDDMDLVCKSKPGIILSARTTGDCTRELYILPVKIFVLSPLHR